MAKSKAPKNNYPYSTKEGNIIPLDILRGKGVLTKTFVAGTSSDIIIPEGWETGILYATETCIIVFETEVGSSHGLTDNVSNDNSMYVPKGFAISSALIEGNASVFGITAGGRIIVQAVERWAGAALDVNYVRR
jgi:hypothetical protein